MTDCLDCGEALEDGQSCACQFGREAKPDNEAQEPTVYANDEFRENA